ncbi:hypothetical protein GobsT_59080 [Gemmata obscuriglobus]|uniref:Uncharacterized protein n=1 Tax=Gemmata obscuriglobus TaxID=114 RepID=A0A2Z3H3W0_9BACT|nr:hypothetical protein [Gemmata obscuriglobus]AWM36304.1 hypothetical protein C1280_04260 [Gemmata obscuriglobus]QEG31087.1 hypothetical protein GobsT_59080 [Gemmata obscuriglobus]VTS10424.1 unnamed protein product [Gemmata obscuriglobus UQM 2246]
MSFRRDKQGEREWRLWVAANEADLIAVGVPREVWADRLTWWRFVDHGYHPPVSNACDVRFRLADLSGEQQHLLYLFLDRVLPEERHGFALWAILHSRFGPADGSS